MKPLNCILIIGILIVCNSCLQKEIVYKEQAINKDQYVIEWGRKKSFINRLRDTFDNIGNHELYEVCRNNKAIILERSCGSDCKEGMILPLKKDATEIHILNFKYSSCDDNIIVTNVDDGTDLEIKIFDFDYNLIKKELIKKETLFNATIKESCIIDVKSVNRLIDITYKGSNWLSNKQDIRHKIISL